jgi:anti-sigma regulatory factor (Ser/Thr protein kinase)
MLVSISTLTVFRQIVAMRALRPPIRLRTVNDEADRSAALPNAGAGPLAGSVTWPVQSSDVAMVRRHVLGSAELAGLDTERAEQFTFAVNEIVINAIRHAGGLATVNVVSVEPDGERNGEIIVTVSDSGPGFDIGRPPVPPPVEQLNGRGLWLVHRMCDDVVIDSSAQGTVVRLRATAPRA